MAAQEEWTQTVIQEILYKQTNKKKITLFLTVRVVKQCHRLPREAVEPSSLEIHKTQLDTVLSNLLDLNVLEKGSWRYLSASTILRPVNINEIGLPTTTLITVRFLETFFLFLSQ